MRTLKEIKALYAPKAQKEDDKIETAGLQIKSADEKRFADKHVIKKIADRNGNGDDVFNATNVKGVERSPKHGYNPGEDEKVYEEVEQADEGYVSLAQQRAVWATRKDGGKGHPDNKKKKMKEETELEEGDVIHFPGKMKAEKEKPDTAPGWMLRKSPELAKKLEDAKARIKKRKESMQEASKAPMDPEKKAKKAIDDILKMHEDPPSEKGMKIGEAKETESVPFEGPYDKPAKKQPGQKSDPGLSTARHLAKQAMLKMIDKTKKEEVEYVNEVLKPSMGAGAYISDFVHSKNPKFAGKSKKERMQQALAAYYAAKRGEK